MSDDIERGPQLDRARVERLAKDILLAVKANYRAGPVSRDRAYEAVNALAISVALVIVGCGKGRAEVGAWFQMALADQLAEAARLSEEKPE